MSCFLLLNCIKFVKIESSVSCAAHEDMQCHLLCLLGMVLGCIGLWRVGNGIFLDRSSKRKADIEYQHQDQSRSPMVCMQ
jgi:hypothetical protein